MLLQRLYRVTNVGRVLQKTVVSRSVHSAHKWDSSAKVARKLRVTSPFIIMGVLGLTKSKDDSETKITIVNYSRNDLLAKADALYDQGDHKSIYDLLSKHKDSKDVEILWRLCRAIYNISEKASDVEAHRLIQEGYDLIHIALDIQEDHYAVHKWMSIFLNSKSTLEGKKAHMNQLYNVKKHMLRASELNPTDATTLYMLGCWCYEIANLTWYQRRIASVILGEPPTSTFEEALTYYENAERIKPNFYSHNLLMLGKTYLKLNRKEDAIKYLKMAAEYSARNDDDQKAKQEAHEILNNI